MLQKIAMEHERSLKILIVVYLTMYSWLKEGEIREKLNFADKYMALKRR
jgi:hypothetical protein